MMSANLRAFLAMIRWAEGTSGPDGYRTIVGGDLFSDFADHPRVRKSGTFSSGLSWSSDAAGAYQFLSRTWARCKQACDLPDFSAESQDRAAIWLVEQRGALLDVEMGSLRAALDKCSYEWASLPPSRYGQPIKTYDACERVFVAAGGLLSQAAGGTPSPEPAPSPPPEPAAPPAQSAQPEAPMPIPVAALLALGGELLKLVPWVKRNPEAAEKVLPKLMEVAREVVPAGNEQSRVEAITSSPDLQRQFTAAVATRWGDVAPFLEYETKEREAARGFAERITTGDGPAWRQIGSGILIAVLSLIIIGGGGALFWTMMESPQLDPGQKGLILGALLTAFTTCIGFWFGSSASGRQSGQTVSDIAKSK